MFFCTFFGGSMFFFARMDWLIGQSHITFRKRAWNTIDEKLAFTTRRRFRMTILCSRYILASITFTRYVHRIIEILAETFWIKVQCTPQTQDKNTRYKIVTKLTEFEIRKSKYITQNIYQNSRTHGLDMREGRPSLMVWKSTGRYSSKKTHLNEINR